MSLTSEERARLRTIQKILAGTGKLENVADDARHVFEAGKYRSYFITTDDRLLKRAASLRTVYTVDILRPSEFLALVHQFRLTQ